MTRNERSGSRKHTHRGTCQICGAVQAFKAGLAKHGYTVDWGFFNGVCAGADHQPLERNKDIAERTIKTLLEEVVPATEKVLAGLNSGTILPKWTKRAANFRLEDVPATREEIGEFEAKRQIESAIRKTEQKISGAKQHASRLRGLIEARFGQPLYPVKREERKPIKAGVSIRIGGKKGWVGEVVEVKDAIAKGCGPYMNGRSMAHAFIRSPKGNIISIPCRTIRQDAILSV